MRAAILVMILALVAVTPVVAWVDNVDAPGTAETGEIYVPVIRIILADDCWIFQSMQLVEGEQTVTVDITTQYSNSAGGDCGGPTEYLYLEPEIVFPTSGTWTLHVVEHAVRPPFGGIDYIWDVTVEVSDQVAAEDRSWGAVKALFR